MLTLVRDRHAGQRARALLRTVAKSLACEAQHSLRFLLPTQGRFTQVWVDFTLRSGLFTLRCFRRDDDQSLQLVTAMPNRFRLRELEATMAELTLPLPRALQRFFVACLSDDVSEIAALAPRVRSMLKVDALERAA